MLLTGGTFPAVAGQDVSPKDATSEGFHYPSTSAEQFLDLIITLADSTRGTFADYATSDPRRDVRYDPHYARFITPGLREAISREETQLVKKNCGGKYVDGEICGMDSDPITCTQDIAEEGYLFRTERTKRDMVIVAYRWPESTKIAGVHRLVRAGGVWKLDGIRCDPTMSFNMP